MREITLGLTSVAVLLLVCCSNNGTDNAIDDLVRAIRSNEVATVESILSSQDIDVDSTVPDEHGATLLMIASKMENEPVVKLLLREGADFNLQDAEGLTALTYAAAYGNAAIVRMLLDAGAAVDLASSTGFTPLMAAAQSGHDVVQVLLSHGVDPSISDEYGHTAMQLAIAAGDVDSVRTLIEYGAAIERTKPVEGETLLGEAAQSGNVELVLLVLAQTTNVDQQDVDGRTPLLIASYNGHVDVVKALLSAGADPNVASNEFMTPLGACWPRDPEQAEKIVTMLLDAGAVVNPQFQSAALTPLHWLAQSRCAACVSALIDAGAAVDARADDGFTPLLMAVRGGVPETVAILLNEGADVRRRTNAQEDVYDLLRRRVQDGETDQIGRMLDRKREGGEVGSRS